MEERTHSCHILRNTKLSSTKFSPPLDPPLIFGIGFQAVSDGSRGGVTSMEESVKIIEKFPKVVIYDRKFQDFYDGNTQLKKINTSPLQCLYHL